MILGVLVGGCPRGGTVFVPPDGNVVFRDDFEGGNLEEGWNFVGEDESKQTLAARDGFLRILPQDTSASCDERDQSYWLRELTGDFIIETFLSYQAAVDLAFAGIAVEDDSGKTAALGLLSARGAAGSFRGVILRVDQCPNPNARRVAESFAFDEVYLRLERTGDAFSGSFSIDGESFTQLGSLTHEMFETVRVGIGIATSDFCSENCTAVDPADFDFFEVSLPETE